eukprot:81710-Hanusia_phi.AAC.1
MRAEPVTITYECSLPSAAPAPVPSMPRSSASEEQRVGRIHIDVEMVEWAIESASKEMASYMLLRKPFFKAVRMNITVSLHWNCLGSPFEHHLTQIVSNEPGTPKPPPAPPQHSSSSSSYPDRLARSSSELSEFEDAISAVDESHADGPSSHPEGADDDDETAGGVLESNFDTFRSFRSSALALTSRLSTFAAHSVLHLNTIRWLKVPPLLLLLPPLLLPPLLLPPLLLPPLLLLLLLSPPLPLLPPASSSSPSLLFCSSSLSSLARLTPPQAFMSAFEKDADPVIRSTGKLEDKSGRARKVTNVKSSFGKHVKAMNIMLLSKNLELDCFYVGEHREFAGDAAAAKSTVLAFTGESLQVRRREGRGGEEAERREGEDGRGGDREKGRRRGEGGEERREERERMDEGKGRGRKNGVSCREFFNLL